MSPWEEPLASWRGREGSNKGLFFFSLFRYPTTYFSSFLNGTFVWASWLTLTHRLGLCSQRCMACCLGFCALTAIQDASLTVFFGGKGGIVAPHRHDGQLMTWNANRFPPRNGVRQVLWTCVTRIRYVHRTEIRSLSRAFCTLQVQR